MALSIIAAVAKNGIIGKEGGLPWYLPEDLKRFKTLTTGTVVVMGRKTWESLPENVRPLPKRTNVVVTRQPGYRVPSGVYVFPSLEEALVAFRDRDVMIIGGGDIYAQAMPLADALYITHIEEDVEGDVFFPSIDPDAWIEKEREPHEGYAFSRYERR